MIRIMLLSIIEDLFAIASFIFYSSLIFFEQLLKNLLTSGFSYFFILIKVKLRTFPLLKKFSFN